MNCVRRTPYHEQTYFVRRKLTEMNVWGYGSVSAATGMPLRIFRNVPTWGCWRSFVDLTALRSQNA